MDANWPSGGVHFDFLVVSVSKASFSVLSDLSSLLCSRRRRRDSRLAHRPLPTRSNPPTFGPNFLHQSQQRPNFRQPKNRQRHHSRTHNKTTTTCHRSKSVIITTPRTSCINLKFTNPTTQAVQLFQHAVALLNLS